MIDKQLRSLLALAAMPSLACTANSFAATNCADLSHLTLPNTTITLAASVAAGAFTPPVPSWARAFMRPTPIPAAFCRVTGEIRPAQDSNIKFEVWLPPSGWSGRYESVGNGGFAGSIRYDSMLTPLLAGSVVASTDDGHDGPAIGPTGADWAFGHPEKVIDYGHRAVHLTAVAAKAITAAFYGRRPTHAYFVGCSKGGQEGFMEAQRYPEDFDGIVSGAAASQWTDLFSSFVWTESLNLANRASYLSSDDLAKIGAAVTAACETPSTAKSGFISDPLRCEVAWSFHGFDLDKTRADAERTVGPIMNADDMSFAGFKARGGKFIAYAGMTDSIVTPLSSVRSYQAVAAAQGPASDPATLTRTQQFYRLFLAPGVGHCGGGAGPNQFGQTGGVGDAQHDMVVALEQWLEKGVPPTRIVATKYIDDEKAKGVAMTRPLCAFPQVAKYQGSGDIADAANFACAVP